MKTEILLGDYVKCKYTGFKGIVINKTEFINGCIQFGVTAKFSAKAPIPIELSDQSIDSQSLEIIKKGPRHKKKEEEEEKLRKLEKHKIEVHQPTGGPSMAMPKMRGR